MSWVHCFVLRWSKEGRIVVALALFGLGGMNDIVSGIVLDRQLLIHENGKF